MLAYNLPLILFGGKNKVMNEKLNHCTEMVELLRTHLSEKHSFRLEWGIIALIAVEVRNATGSYCSLRKPCLPLTTQQPTELRFSHYSQLHIWHNE